MNEMSRRPLYSNLARVYDLIIRGPVIDRCNFIQDMATQRGFPPRSRILDAGCGTGSYAIELAKRGYDVTGLDTSAELISVAGAKAEKADVIVLFQTGDILELASRPIYDGILCRGVLNDIIDDQRRQQAFISFSQALHRHGILILDVREWTSTAHRKEKEPVFEKAITVNEGILTFRAVTSLDRETKQLHIAESYILERDNADRSIIEYNFVMQCWTRDELHSGLMNAGFKSVVYLGDYDSGCPIGSTDRIVAVASI